MPARSPPFSQNVIPGRNRTPPPRSNAPGQAYRRPSRRAGFRREMQWPAQIPAPTAKRAALLSEVVRLRRLRRGGRAWRGELRPGRSSSSPARVPDAGPQPRAPGCPGRECGTSPMPGGPGIWRGTRRGAVDGPDHGGQPHAGRARPGQRSARASGTEGQPRGCSGPVLPCRSTPGPHAPRRGVRIGGLYTGSVKDSPRYTRLTSGSRPSASGLPARNMRPLLMM